MKIAVDIGHNRGQDQGAVGVGSENVMNIDTGDKVIAKLKALGHDVLDVISQIPNNVTVNQSLAMRVSLANNWSADLYVAIHHNCGGGHGVEVWCGSQSSVNVAQKICDNIVSLGFTNRGAKIQGQNGYEHLYVLNHTSMPAVLTEGCFVDSQDDMSKYDSEDMSNAIVKGVTGQAVASNPHYYIVTSYIPQGTWGIELNAIWYKYFMGVGLDRWFIKNDTKGMWIVTQYMSLVNAKVLADRLKADGLLFQLVTE